MLSQLKKQAEVHIAELKADFKKFVNNWMAKSMRNVKPQTPQDNQANYKKYVPPVINDEDIATPEEIQEILKGNR